MTILEPNKKSKNRKINFMFFASLISLAFVAVWSIMVYNQTINLAFRVNGLEREHKALSAKNAEFKNNLYSKLDAKKLSAVALSRGLVKVPNPDYIEAESLPILASR